MKTLLPFSLILVIGLQLLTNGAQAADSTAQLVFPKPIFTLQPTNQSVALGDRVQFTAAALGAMIVGYQWHKDGVAIGGATSTQYVIPSVRNADAGIYNVGVRNPAGWVFSSNATLSVSCSYTLASNFNFMTFEGGARTLTAFTTGGCALIASTTNDWITLTNRAQGTSTNLISYTVRTNSSSVPRTGIIRLGTNKFTIAQGVEFAPTNLAARTLSFIVATNAGVVRNSNFVFTAASGTNRFFRVSSVTNSPYLYSKTTSKTATLSFPSNSFQLSFLTPRSGRFTGTNTIGAQSGSFTLAAAGANLNFDGFGDILMQNTNTGTNHVIGGWTMRRSEFLTNVVDGTLRTNLWTAIGQSDFNADGKEDFWFRRTTGEIGTFARTTGSTNAVLLQAIGPSASPWLAMNINDFNADGKPDVLLQNSTNRQIQLRFYNGTNLVGSHIVRDGVAAAAGWKPVATGDMNGDRQPDIWFQHTGGNISAWLMNGSQFITVDSPKNAPAIPTGLRLSTVGDFNADGHMDLVWQNATNQVVVWYMNNLNVVRQATLRGGTPVQPGQRIFPQ
jgi:hypothetical protein